MVVIYFYLKSTKDEAYKNYRSKKATFHTFSRTPQSGAATPLLVFLAAIKRWNSLFFSLS